MTSVQAGRTYPRVAAPGSNTVWRNHFTPQFYLRNWTTPPDGHLWRYHRPHATRVVEQRVAPVSTGYQRDLYTAPPATPIDTWAPDIFETEAFSKVDNDAARLYPRLLARERLNDDDRRAWALFLNSLLERHPQQLNARDEKARQIAEELRVEYETSFTSARAKNALSLIDLNTMATNTVRTHMWKEINDPEVLNFLMIEHAWFVASPAGMNFITSECPLIVNADDLSSRPIHMLTLPLSPQALFVSIPRSWLNDPAHDRNIRLVVAVHNQLLVRARPRCVYAASKILDAEDEPLRTLIENTLPVSPSV